MKELCVWSGLNICSIISIYEHDKKFVFMKHVIYIA